MTRPTDADRHWLTHAIELSRRCPPSATAFSVGCVVVDATGFSISSGYSRDSDEVCHAEESALGRLSIDQRLTGVTLYTSLEPCSARRSRPHSCAELILAARIGRVVFAAREPSLFVADCVGVEILAAAGVTVVEVAGMAELVYEINADILGPDSPMGR
ncbi:dCMP deaminase [Streptosporangium sp. NPDC000396]|uniref:dCMP deaminase n=1 Tax=Streptosporangium sp. NPDC000396 TaxID=3366185 RepID=UPI0036BBECF2